MCEYKENDSLNLKSNWNSLNQYYAKNIILAECYWLDSQAEGLQNSKGSNSLIKKKKKCDNVDLSSFPAIEIVGRFTKQITGVMKRESVFLDFKVFEIPWSTVTSLHTLSSSHWTMFNLYNFCTVTHFHDLNVRTHSITHICRLIPATHRQSNVHCYGWTLITHKYIYTR